MAKTVAGAPSPPGMRVPDGGSNCAKCIYLSPFNESECVNTGYVNARYLGKRAGDGRFVDGKTGDVIGDPNQFCCNFFDWEG